MSWFWTSVTALTGSAETRVLSKILVRSADSVLEAWLKLLTRGQSKRENFLCMRER